MWFPSLVFFALCNQVTFLSYFSLSYSEIYNTGETTKQPPMFKVIRKDGIYFFEFESFRDLWGLGN